MHVKLKGHVLNTELPVSVYCKTRNGSAQKWTSFFRVTCFHPFFISFFFFFGRKERRFFLGGGGGGGGAGGGEVVRR